MLKKTLIIGAFLAIGLSPLLPSVRADVGQWNDLMATASWDYDLYRIERLATRSDVQGPFELGETVYFTQPAKSAKGAVTDKVDLTIYAGGQSFTIPDVNDAITQKTWRTAQDDRMIFRTPSTSDKNWFVVSEYNPTTKTITNLIEPVKAADELSFMSLAADGSRVYTSMLNTDVKTSDVGSKLSVQDYETGYARRDFTFTLTAPWQEILDVKGENVLAKFHFKDGSKQLLVINERARTVTAVPESWGEAHESLEAAHFMSNGGVQYFKSYRMFTWTPGETEAIEAGGAFLNWDMDVSEAYQIANSRMAWINPDNGLYVSDVGGATSFGKVLNGEYTLTNDAIYFRGTEGYVGFTFADRSWTKELFLVTDVKENAVIGLDSNKNIWYKNPTTGRVLNIGFGTDPLLTERDRAIYRGTDGNLYQATFSPLVDLAPKDIQAFKAFGEPAIYLVSNNKMWSVPDESTYFSWFESFDQVTEVSKTTLEVYKDVYEQAGPANYAPGTRVKSTANPRVYVVGQNGTLHWITSETVASSIWGTRWNKGIMNVRPEALWRYQMGTDVNSSNEIKSI